MTIIGNYIFFYGYDWPSNFASSTIVELDPFWEETIYDSNRPIVTFKTAEAYYQSRKALVANDKHRYYKIAHAKTPGETKRIAREIKLKSREWDAVRIGWMVQTLKKKFEQNDELRVKFLNPELDGKIFVEASPTDTFWGIGKSELECTREVERTGGLETFDYEHDIPCGFNVLGELLNNLRDDLVKNPVKSI